MVIGDSAVQFELAMTSLTTMAPERTSIMTLPESPAANVVIPVAEDVVFGEAMGSTEEDSIEVAVIPLARSDVPFRTFEFTANAAAPAARTPVNESAVTIPIFICPPHGECRYPLH